MIATRWRLLVSFGTGVGVTMVVFALIAGGGDDEAPRASAPTDDLETEATTTVVAAPTVAATQIGASPAVERSPLPLPLEQHDDYREYTSAELTAAGFVDSGSFIKVPYNPSPAVRATYRAGFTALEMTAAGYVDLNPDGWHPGHPPDGGFSSTLAAGFIARVDGVQLYAVVSSRWSLSQGTTGLVPVGTEGLTFYAVDGGKPHLILDVTTFAREQIPAIVDVRGHLWVRLEPLPPGPTADDTGERLRVRDATTTFGPLPPGVGNWPNLTWCEGSSCVAILHLHTGGGLAAITDGPATCEAAEDSLIIELTTAAWTLRFAGAPPNAMAVPPCKRGFPRDVTVGELLSSHPSWETSAFAPKGTQLHVAADGEGMLYIDVQRAIATCPPCYTGS